ncbi:MAG: tyrosine-type recombinase/integrase [Kiloniellales bacterium]|nr:tyrosine-type recombinase/integrase [Kiloniellales bacterium]
MKFTDKGIQGLKPRTSRYEIWSDNDPGLGLRVSPKGVKSWTFVYRFHGRSRRMTLGQYPGMGLAAARVAYATAKEDLHLGRDPGSALVSKRRDERQAETVADLSAEYIERHAKPNKKSWQADEQALDRDVLPLWRERKARDISRRDVIALLDDIVDRGAGVTANRTLSLLRKMFAFAVERGILDSSPCYLVKPPTKEVARDRVLTTEEIKTFWHGLNDAAMSATSKLALRFLLVTAQRPGEVAGAQWSEIDLDAKTWTIPSERAKNGRTHLVPLNDMALELLSEAKEISKKDDGEETPVNEEPSVFPANGSAITRHALSRALLRWQETSPPDGGRFTPHDLRRTAASHMTAAGISRFVVDRLLNHADGGVGAIYDRHSYLPEKTHAAAVWSDRLTSAISGERASANVVKLETAHG